MGQRHQLGRRGAYKFVKGRAKKTLAQDCVYVQSEGAPKNL
jgi:hypothetical protein